MQVQSIGLSERWTRIANILPSSISAGSSHPNLFVDPSGFRRVVTKSLETCETFLTTLQTIGDGLEKRIPGITSYYGLVEGPKNSFDYGGRICNASGTTVTLLSTPSSLYTMANDSYSQQMQTSVEQKPEQHDSIFEQAGYAILYNKRKLEQSERISFERALSILHKLDSLRRTTLDCITTFGALNEVLEVGKVFSKTTKSEIHYYGEHAIKEEIEIEEDKIALSQYWNTLSCVNRIRMIEKKLSPELEGILV